MSEEKSTADAVTVESLQLQLQEAESARLKAEEKAAYAQREVEKLKPVKADRDKMIDDNATKGDPDAIKRLKEEHQSKLAELEEELKAQLNKTKAELDHERVTKGAIQVAAQYFNDDALDLIESKINKYCGWEDGSLVIKNDKGEVRYSEENKREKMSVQEFMKELAGKYPSCAKATSVAGTKQSGYKSNGGSKSWSMANVNAMTPVEQKEFFSKNTDAAREILKNYKI